MRDIRKCDLRIVDIFELIKMYDKKGETIHHLLSNHVKPLLNKYLSSWKNESSDVLPHLIVFPWLTIIKLK